MTSSIRHSFIPVVALSLATLAGGCDALLDAPTPYQPEEIDRTALAGFESCDDLLDYAQYRALQHVGPYGFNGSDGWGVDDAAEGGDGGGDPGVGVPAGGDEGGGGEQAPDFSETNAQELGVDEPDIIKTDGTRILAVAQGNFHYIDVGGPTPTLTHSIPVIKSTQGDGYYGYDGTQMLVQGDRVLLSVRRSGWELPEQIRTTFGLLDDESMPVVQLTELDISDPNQIEVVSNLYVEGGYVSGRMHENTARVVLSHPLGGLAFKYPWDFLDENDVVFDEWSGGWDDLAYQRAEAESEAYNRRLVIDTDIEDWMPRYVFEGRDGLQEGPLVACERMMRPGTHAGLGTLSVLTFDLRQPLALGDVVGLLSEGQTVYASAHNLYVATRPFFAEEDSSISSYIHQFDLSNATTVRYVASGEVPGYLLNQWAMSEYEGDLRVATTDERWSDRSQSYVTVLRSDGPRLEEIGQVGGLGYGEQIYAVRFIDDVGYVVTFRQIDPLYTIDLSNPRDPQMVGELKIEGYSAYLHPVGEHLLLGVGRDGTADGQVLGTQLSLFDVHDPANPTVVSQASLGEWGSSEVEFDHHAFTYWGPEKLAVLPVETWSWDEENGEEEFFTGAVAYRIDPESGIELVGTIAHEQATIDDVWFGDRIRRSLVIDDQLFTMSEEGLQRSGLADLVPMGWLEF